VKTKICTNCGGEPRPLSEFYRAKKGKYGRKAICKVCDNIAYQKYAKTDSGKLNNYNANKKWRLANTDKCKAHNKKWVDNNWKEHREKNKERINAYGNKWAKNNQEKKALSSKNNKIKAKETLNNCYIKGLLTSNSNLKASDISIELVGLKRIHIKITRELRK